MRLRNKEKRIGIILLFDKNNMSDLLEFLSD